MKITFNKIMIGGAVTSVILFGVSQMGAGKDTVQQINSERFMARDELRAVLQRGNLSAKEIQIVTDLISGDRKPDFNGPDREEVCDSLISKTTGVWNYRFRTICGKL